MYFHKDVGNLTLAESALLAGMIQSPNPYNPFRHAQKATERRNQVIRAMNDAGFIDEATMQAALDEPLKVRARHRRHLGSALLHRSRAHPAPPALRREGPDHPEPGHPHLSRPAAPVVGPGGPHPGPRQRREDDQEEGAAAARAGLPHRPRALERRRGGPRGGTLLRHEPVQPGDRGPPAARQHLQALRLPRRLRGHLRRPGPASHHSRHRGGGRARRLLLRRQGVHPAELRGQVPRLRHPAQGAGQQPQRGHGEGGGDGGLRPHRQPLGEEAGHRPAHQALSAPWPWARSRPPPTRWRPPTTCWPTAGSRSSR